MLELKNIKKDYAVGDSKVHALKGISLSFRQSEFVSILGPSGCGKTTMLNIIGGLDHYTSGDLIIDNVSTKSYSARDWDTYRNHRVGFIFQSYNLIPHQTILENVELALNISGVEKKERVRRAKQALDKVGLKDQYNKKPNQLSGGQCQRVAIARALVNEPEILLADEPTGALDSETSVQIMDLIQEIAKECLVIMVTHNPELAEKYSTRIIKLLDGEVLSDSNPYTGDENITVQSNKKNANKKSKLSFWSAFKLSAKNLWSKFKRTFMVCLAGSIGIIGVATVLAVSSGVQGYIASMQNDMLSGNPVSISEETIDLSALIEASGDALTKEALKESTQDGYVNVEFMIDYLLERSGDETSFKVTNNITQDYVDYVKNMPEEYYAAISTEYGLNLSNNIYTDFAFEGQTNNKMSLSAALEVYTAMLGKVEGYESFAKYISLYAEDFMQSINNEEFVLSQYNMIAGGKIAKEKDEVMIVLSDDNALSDLLLAQFGYYSQEEFFNIVYKATDDEEHYDSELWKDKFLYEDIIGKEFVWYPNDTIYTKNESTILSEYFPFYYSAYGDESWTGGIPLKITAILTPKDDIAYGCLETGFYYTEALANYILENSSTSQIVQWFNENEYESYDSYYIDESTNKGITFKYSFKINGTKYENCTGFVGSSSMMGMLMGGGSGAKNYTLTLREIGGKDIPSKIKIYPKDFELKDGVTDYLKVWNSDQDIVIGERTITAAERSNVQYTDNLAIVIGIVNNLVNIVTTALVAFTALSLVVSTVMVAIITYVSVMERVKEIGVIRSLGGRKRDVSSLFIAETFIIGSVSGVIGIAITYAISGILNLIVGNLIGIYTIASLPFTTALIMIAISIGLTLISGLIPATAAAKKDPVEALRTE